MYKLGTIYLSTDLLSYEISLNGELGGAKGALRRES